VKAPHHRNRFRKVEALGSADPAKRVAVSSQHPVRAATYRTHLLRWYCYQREKVNSRRPVSLKLSGSKHLVAMSDTAACLALGGFSETGTVSEFFILPVVHLEVVSCALSRTTNWLVNDVTIHYNSIGDSSHRPAVRRRLAYEEKTIKSCKGSGG
jgi:hypothetical protein